jgi:alpha-methylacyl-CoA racemase
MLLDAVRVVDISRLLPGGYCSRLLQQQGAAVIKLEAPDGDPLRHLAGGAALFDALHSGKTVISLDLRSSQGRQRFLEEIRRADVLVEGFRPGVMERLELGYQRLAELRPQLVYCAITGYGSSGARTARAGHDLNYLAVSGALSLMPRPLGLPVIPGLQIADLAGGLQGAFLIAAALAQRGASGRGARVEVSMAELMKSWTEMPRAARRAGVTALPLTGELPCYRVYETSDGCLTVAALEERFWAALCRALEREDLVLRQFDSSAIPDLEDIFKRASREQWTARLAGVDACVEPVLSLDESGRDSGLTDF